MVPVRERKPHTFGVRSIQGNFNKFKRPEIIQSVFSNHIKLEISKRNITGKYPYLESKQHNNTQMKEKVSRELKKKTKNKKNSGQINVLFILHERILELTGSVLGQWLCDVIKPRFAVFPLGHPWLLLHGLRLVTLLSYSYSYSRQKRRKRKEQQTCSS